MQFVEPTEKTTVELPSPMEVVSEALLLHVSGIGAEPSAEHAARVAFKALHDAGYRIAVARKQWR